MLAACIIEGEWGPLPAAAHADSNQETSKQNRNLDRIVLERRSLQEEQQQPGKVL